VLVPALMLVLITLAAVGVDMALLHGAQRSLYRTASASADDAAGMLDGRRLQQDGSIQVDCDAARRVVTARMAVADLPGRLSSVTIDCDARTVTVRLRVAVDHVFLGAVPGLDDTEDVPMTARARLQP
jgi:hypothetical protein